MNKVDKHNNDIFTPGSLDVVDWNIDFHNLMLKDTLRMKAYKKAIFETIKPGMVVCDLGVGTGILSRWALEAGAQRVYGIEMNPELMNLAKVNLELFKEAFIPVYGNSFNVEIPEKVDCIISEILGNIMDNEDCVSILKDAERRFLKKEGIMLPKFVQSFIVPVSYEEANNLISRKEIYSTHIDSNLLDQLHKLDLSDLYNFYYDSLIWKNQYLSYPEKIVEMKKGYYEEFYHKEFYFSIIKEGVFTGFKGFFSANLTSHVQLDIESAVNYSISWKHAYFPIENIISVKKNDIIKMFFERDKYGKYILGGEVLRNNNIILKFYQKLKF